MSGIETFCERDKYGGWLCTADGTIINLYPVHPDWSITKVETPESIKGIPIKKIGHNVFDCYPCLTEITIHDGVEELVPNLFYTYDFHTYKLKKITIPKSLKKITELPFVFCPNLKTLVIGDDVKKIVDGPRDCITLNGHTILEGIEVDEFGTWYYKNDGTITRFYPAEGVTKVKTPENIKGIPIKKISDSHYDSNFLKKNHRLEEVSIHDGVEELDKTWFCRAYTINKITIPQSVKKINGPLFKKYPPKTIILGDDTKEIVDGPRDCITLNGHTILEGIEVDNSGTWHYTSDGTITFFVKNENTTKVKIPDKIRDITIKKIDFSALNTSSVQELTIPESVKEISNYLFLYYADSFKDLKEIIVHDSNNFDVIKKVIFRGCHWKEYRNPLTFTLKRTGQKDISITVKDNKTLKNLKEHFMIVDGISLKQRRDNINIRKALGSFGIVAGTLLVAVAFVSFAPIAAAISIAVGAASLIAGSIIVDKARKDGNMQDFLVALPEDKDISQKEIEEIGNKAVAKDMQWRSWFKKAKAAGSVKDANEILKPMMFQQKQITK